MRQITSFVLAYVLFAVWTLAPINDCLSLNSRNYLFNGSAFAQDSNTLDCNAEENKDGAKCQTTTLKYEDDAYSKASLWLSTITIIISIFVNALAIGYCTQSTAGLPTCGWATAMAGIGSVALLAGEVISTIMYKDTVKQFEYNPSLLRRYKDKCASNPEEVEEVVGAGEIKICDQLDSLNAQKESYEAMKKALTWKIGLFITGGVAMLIASIMEFAATKIHTAEIVAASIVAANAPQAIAAEVSAFMAANSIAAGARAAEATACNTGCTGGIASFHATLMTVNSEYFAGSFVPSYELVLPMATTLANAHNTMLDHTVPISGAAPTGPQSVACKIGSAAMCPVTPRLYSSKVRIFMDKFLCPPWGVTGICSASYWGLVERTTDVEVPLRLEVDQIEFWKKFIGFFGVSAIAEDRRDTSNTNLAKGGFRDWARIIAGSFVGIFFSLLAVSKQIVNALFAKHWARGIWYAGIEVLIITNVVMMFKAKKKIQDHIDQLETILNQTAATPGSSSFSDADIDYAGLANFMEGQEDPTLPPEYPNFPCPGGGNGKGGCNDPTNANNVSLQTLGLESLAGLAGSANTFGKSLGGNKGLDKNARMAAGNMLRNATKLKKMQKDLLKKLKNDLANSPMAGLNLDREQGKIFGNLSKAITNTLKKNNVSPEQFANGLNVNTGDPAKAPIAAASVFPSTDVGSASLSSDQQSFDFQLPTEENNDMELDALADQTVSGLEVTSDDINTNGDGNIFSLISTRYMKSGYPRLFDEQVTPTEAPALQEVSP